jgi:predicted acetyltransferase
LFLVMASTYHYGPVRDDGGELDELGRLIGAAFGIAPDLSRQWLASNLSQARVLRRRERVVGGLLLLPMGQFHGGRRVSMTGIAGVGVDPIERGQGAATRLMHAAVAELHASGAALSVLFPATVPLYRRAGYEIAGGLYRIRAIARAIGVAERNLSMRPIERDDARAIERIYRKQAAQRSGWLDRSPYIWDRVHHSPKGSATHGYLVEGGRGPEGYVFYRQDPIANQATGFHLWLTDLAAGTGAAARRLLTFLADHGSQAREVTWHGGVDDPFLALLPERGHEIALLEPWMLRVVDVARALTERGWPRHVDVRLELDVRDELLATNRGRFVLDLADGAAEVRRGGRGTLALDCRALAALYSGHATPWQLAHAGRLTATDSALSRAAVAFAGPPPSLPDFF